VVANFFGGFDRDIGEPLISALRQRCQLQQIEGIEQYRANDHIAKMPIRLLHEQQVFEFAIRAAECKIILPAARAFDFTRVGIKHASLAQVVERKIGIRQLFFQNVDLLN